MSDNNEIMSEILERLITLEAKTDAISEIMIAKGVTTIDELNTIEQDNYYNIMSNIFQK